MQTFSEIQRACDALGIKITITKAKGDNTHGRRENAAGPRT
jgi:hypothetical protein